MSKIIETKRFDDENIIKLWREAFGDTREDIQFFLDSCEYKSIVCYYDDNEQLASMLFLVDCAVEKSRYKYIYAACTDRNYQNKGLMTALLNFAKDCYSSILLIPANQGLIEYYNKRGFQKEISIDDIKFFEIEDIVEYLFDGCELSKPIALAYEGE